MHDSLSLFFKETFKNDLEAEFADHNKLSFIVKILSQMCEYSDWNLVLKLKFLDTSGIIPEDEF